MYQIEIYPQKGKPNGGKHSMRVRHINTQIVLPPEGHHNKADVVQLALNLKAHLANAPIYFLDENGEIISKLPE